MALFVAMGVFAGTRELLRGRLFEGAVSFGFVVMFVVLGIAMQLLARCPTVLRASHDGTGTLLRPNRIIMNLLIAVLVYFIPLGLAVVIFTLTGDLQLFPSKRARIAAMVLMALTTMTVVSGLLTARRRGGVGYVKLTPTGIDIADVKSTESVAWADIVGVDDHSDVNKKIRRAAVLRRREGAETSIGSCDLYVPNGVGLYWMVWHYWRHPDDRVELTDGRALARLEEGRFDTTSV
ncbi:MAG: hypothetical protein M3O32_21175 [Actinomycetota bacterium]|nr:hypothetical protein [Actinomycetota bacterium]